LLVGGGVAGERHAFHTYPLPHPLLH
jgi:hypothetical protein